MMKGWANHLDNNVNNKKLVFTRARTER